MVPPKHERILACYLKSEEHTRHVGLSLQEHEARGKT